MALCVHSNFFLQDLCHEYFRKTWSFSRLMACWQRRGQINHLQIQSVLYFSLYEKTGSSLTLCHPSTNAPNMIKLLNISCGDQSVLLTAFTQVLLNWETKTKWNEKWRNETKRNEVGRHIIDHLQEILYLCKLFSHLGLWLAITCFKFELV
jgi:hypothetical protein